VLSSAQGIVQRIGEMRGYGRYVIVRHESNYLTVYSNLGAVQVRQNQRIPQGRQIGTVDRDEPWLHFQINQSGRAKNPLELLPERGRGMLAGRS